MLRLLRRGVRDGSLCSLPNMAIIQWLAYGAPHYLNEMIDKTMRANAKAASCPATIESSYLKTPSVLLCNYLIVLDSCRFGSRHTSRYLFDEYFMLTDSHLCEKFGTRSLM